MYGALLFYVSESDGAIPECVARLLSDMSVVGIIFVGIVRNIFRIIIITDGIIVSHIFRNIFINIADRDIDLVIIDTL